MNLPVACWCIFNATTGVVSYGSGCTVALNTAQQKWTITPDADIVGAAGFTPDGLFMPRGEVNSEPGATARDLLFSFTAGDLLEVFSIDPATGLAANADGEVKVVIERLPYNP